VTSQYGTVLGRTVWAGYVSVFRRRLSSSSFALSWRRQQRSQSDDRLVDKGWAVRGFKVTSTYQVRSISGFMVDVYTCWSCPWLVDEKFSFPRTAGYANVRVLSTDSG